MLPLNHPELENVTESTKNQTYILSLIQPYLLEKKVMIVTLLGPTTALL